MGIKQQQWKCSGDLKSDCCVHALPREEICICGEMGSISVMFAHKGRDNFSLNAQ